MKLFRCSALLGAAGLATLSLSAHAIGSTNVADTSLFESDAKPVTTMQLAQRRDLFTTSSGSVGFKKSKKKKAKTK
jgi:hypothetical protein